MAAPITIRTNLFLVLQHSKDPYRHFISMMPLTSAIKFNIISGTMLCATQFLAANPMPAVLNTFSKKTFAVEQGLGKMLLFVQPVQANESHI